MCCCVMMQKLSEGDMGFNGKPFAGVTSETSNGTLFLISE